jgi:hypothetical protein
MFKYLISDTWRKKRRHVQEMSISLKKVSEQLSIGNILDVRLTPGKYSFFYTYPEHHNSYDIKRKKYECTPQ